MKLSTGKYTAFAIILLILSIVLYDYLNHTYIKVEFKKTDPMPPRMGVYYKGYKLGNSTKLNISRDFQKTYLSITLNQRGLHLPNNIRAEVKSYNGETTFVDIIYPKAPSIKYIKSGDVIKGICDIHGDERISESTQAHLDTLFEKGERLLSSATVTTDTLTNLLSLTHNILLENRKNILSSTISLKNSLAELETTTKNISETSKDFTNISKNFNKTGTDLAALMPKLNDLVDMGKRTLCKLDYILTGLGETLRKHAGGMRVLFGVPIKD